MTSFPSLPCRQPLLALTMTAFLWDLPLALTLTYLSLGSYLGSSLWLAHRHPPLATLFAFALAEIHDLTMTSSLAYSLRCFLSSPLTYPPLAPLWDLPLASTSTSSLGSMLDGPNVLEDVGVELARTKAENRRMAMWLRAKKLSVKWKKKELRRIKRVNRLLIAANKRMQELVDDFLLPAEADNNHVRQMNEAIQGMNDLNLDGNYNITTVNQVQLCCSSGSAADGDNNGYNRGGGDGNNGGGHHE